MRNYPPRRILYSIDSNVQTEAIKKAQQEQTQKQQQDLLSKNGGEVRSGEINVEATNGSQGLLERPEKKEAPKDKTKPISSTPISGTPWYVLVLVVTDH